MDCRLSITTHILVMHLSSPTWSTKSRDRTVGIQFSSPIHKVYDTKMAPNRYGYGAG
jgi:hypothetical protein